MKLKLHMHLRTGIILLLVLFNYVSSFGQCNESDGQYYVFYSWGDNITSLGIPETGSSTPPMIYGTEDFPTFKDGVRYNTGCGQDVSTTQGDTQHVNIRVNCLEEDEGRCRVNLSYLVTIDVSASESLSTSEAIRAANDKLFDGLCDGNVYNGFCDGIGRENRCYDKGKAGSNNGYITFGDMVIRKVIFRKGDRWSGEPYQTVYENGAIIDIDCCPVSSLSIEPTSYLEGLDPSTNVMVSNIWNTNNALDFTKAFEIKNQDGNILKEEEKAKVKWYVQDIRDLTNIIDYEIPTESLSSFDLTSISEITQMNQIGVKAEYQCQNGLITHDSMTLLIKFCSYPILIEPTSYLEKTDPDTGTKVTDVWNADDPFDFTKAFKLVDLDGNPISDEELENVKWYVEDRSKQDGDDDKFIYVDPDAPYNTPEEYYFNGEKNVDQWGAVEIKIEYTCGNSSEVFTTYSTIEILDIGMYFRNAAGDILRWNKGVYDKYPAAYDGFYDPSKDIVMHSHGWARGGNGNHKSDPVANPVRDRLDEDGIGEWHNKYNVLLFFWTQSAEHKNEVTTTHINFIEPSKRPFTRDPKWVRENSPESRVGTSGDPIGKICGQQIKEIINTTGFDYAAREVRLTGWSFGAIVITRAAELLGTAIVDRMAYLDPATTAPFLEYYKNKIMPTPSIMPPTEWYQSSAYDLAWQPSSALISGIGQRDVYNQMILNTTYVRIDPFWESGYPFGGGLLHASAKEHYFKSLTAPQPKIVNNVNPNFQGGIIICPDQSEKSESRPFFLVQGYSFYANPLFFKCFDVDGPRKGPSAAASLDDLKFYQRIPLEQVHGITTVDVSDDRYTPRNLDINGYLIGQEYTEIDISIGVINDADDITLSWGINNKNQRQSLNKNQSITPNYYVILDQDLKTIGITSENSYTVEDLTPNTSYEFTVVPIGSDGYPTGYDKVEASTYDPLPIALGIINNFQVDKKTWHEVTFSSPMYNPSVVFGPASYNDEEPVTIRVKDITNFGFKYQFDEWDYQDGSHSNETISYLAISEGVTRFGGLTMESAVVADVNHTAKSVDFKNEFTTKPIVFTQVSSFEGGSAVVPRVENVSTLGFDLKVQEEQGNDNKHAKELVSYIAIEPGTYRYSNGLTLIVGSDTFNHNFKSLNFSGIENPVFIASMQTTNGGDPSGLRYRDLTTSSVQLKLEEEQSKDEEVWHTNEEVGYFIYGMEEVAALTASESLKESISLEEPIRMYPNPTANKLFLHTTTQEIKVLSVIDLNGRILITHDVVKNNLEIDVSMLTNGMYILKAVTKENEEKNFTFVKSR